MIDSPCPRPMPEMPEPLVELLEQTGMFVGSRLTGLVERQMKMETKLHLVACVRALKYYEPTPVEVGERLERSCVPWVKFGMFETIVTAIASAWSAKIDDWSDGRAVESEGSLQKGWLTAQRRSFNGWEKLLGRVECSIVDGDHFSIMNRPRVRNPWKCLPILYQ